MAGFWKHRIDMKARVKYSFIFLFSCFVLLHTFSVVHAEYVLPYPSFMPGNKLYKVMEVVDLLKKYWSFGNIAQVKYHLSRSDKYLVEAKTLIEYKQYLLGSSALQKSTSEFLLIDRYLTAALAEGKDVAELRQIVADAAAVHIETLNAIEKNAPSSVTWTPEKTSATDIDFSRMVTDAKKACAPYVTTK
jgi:hypothetical protein